MHVVHHILSWIQSQAVERFIPFPKYSENIVNPLAELLGSFERNHRVTRRPLNPLFRLIFFTNIAISEVHNASLEDIWTHG